MKKLFYFLFLTLIGCGSGGGGSSPSENYGGPTTYKEYLMETHSGTTVELLRVRISSTNKFEVLNINFTLNTESNSYEIREWNLECGTYTNDGYLYRMTSNGGAVSNYEMYCENCGPNSGTSYLEEVAYGWTEQEWYHPTDRPAAVLQTQARCNL